MLQSISPGEIQHCENAQNFSKSLVTEWLTNYKFKFWDTHSSTGKPVTIEDKKIRAKQIADKLCKHSDWLTHGRSIPIKALEEMGLKITDYSKDKLLNDAITRYYTLLKMSFESTNIYKIIETTTTQILRFAVPNAMLVKNNHEPDSAMIDFECPSCKTKHSIQLKLNNKAVQQQGKLPFPKNDIFVCPNCKINTNLAQLRLQIESQTGKK